MIYEATDWLEGVSL